MRALRALGAAAAAAFAVAAFTPAAAVFYRSLSAPARSGPVDAVVVLGAGATGDMLTDSSLRRLVEGMRLHRTGRVPLLVLLGPAYESRSTEAALRARLAGELGVPAEAVVVEDRGRTTREEAQRVAEVLRPRGAARILLVSGADHLPRAAALFERAGFEVRTAPVVSPGAESARPEARLGLARALAGELAARAYYRLAGFR
ncbi:MAG TPA: YdcF family protein [Vicinamibacteria bacterium]|jgi:uncharacterized SAM-binding protein YcdF (DUF218 family)